MQPITLHCLTLNIHKGVTTLTRSTQLEDLKLAIESVGADLVFLQEVTGDHEGGAQYEYLADRLWPHYAYAKNSIYTKGHHGNAILSKFPIISEKTIDVSQNRVDQRGILHSVISVQPSEQPVHAFCVHFGLLSRWRHRQMTALLNYITESVPQHEPVIIGGDFNDWTFSLDTQARRGGFNEIWDNHPLIKRATFPAGFPILSMDRIYYRQATLESAEILKNGIWRYISDHCAVTANLTL